MTAVEWFVNRLSERGVAWMATLCGHGLDPLFQAAKRAGIRLVDTRNEQTAGYVAEYYGRLTRQPGVCAVSSGVAHANAMTGVVNAFFDGAPMLLISGAGALRTAGMGHFQDLDQVALAAPATRYSRVIDCAGRAVSILDEALDAAVQPEPGPVHLTFPMDIQNTEVAREEMIQSPPGRRAPPAGEDDVDRTASALARAERPLIIAGSGLHYAGTGEEMLRFSGRYSVPVVVPIWDRGVINRPAATFLGVVGAATGGPRLLADADCIIMAGAVSDYRVGFLQPGPIRADATVTFLEHGWRELQTAYEQTGGTAHTQWLAQAQQRQREFRQAVEKTAASQAKQGTHSSDIISALRQVLTADTVLLIDGGSIGQWAHQLLCDDHYPGDWLTCGRSGVVGWGVGGAMAARLAYPERPVILLSGDGSFTFNVADIECAVRQSLPFVVVVADDQDWGIVRLGQIERLGEAIASSLGPIAIDQLSRSLGARGVRVTRPDEIEPALHNALSGSAVTVIHVPIVGGNPGA
jgi:acetolactate synthase-1/2/3 large subunit